MWAVLDVEAIVLPLGGGIWGDRVDDQSLERSFSAQHDYFLLFPTSAVSTGVAILMADEKLLQ